MFGSYRAPTGVGEAAAPPPDGDLGELRAEVARLQEKLGRRPKILVGKPGLDGHSNGAEQIAVRARDAGMDVVYEGIRLTPAQIAASALQEGVHVIGLSILSGSHRELIPAVIDALREAGVTVPVVVGGIIPEQDVAAAAAGGRRRCLHAEGLRHHPDHARHRGAGGQLRRAHPGRRGRLGRRRRGVSGEGAALGARLRERDLSAAPAALNLLESAAPDDRQQAAALLREVSPATLGGEAPGHIVGVTGPPGAGKSTLLSALLGQWRARGQSVALLAVDPSSRRSGGSLLGDRARIDFDPSDRRVLIRSTAAGERLGGLARPTRAAAEALAAAFDVVVIETVGVGQAETEVADVADTRRRRRAAGQRRRAAVPEVGDHGDTRRAGRHQVRPRPAGDAHQARPDRRSALAGVALDPGAGRLLAAADERDRGAGGGAGRAPRRP